MVTVKAPKITASKFSHIADPITRYAVKLKKKKEKKKLYPALSFGSLCESVLSSQLAPIQGAV